MSGELERERDEAAARRAELEQEFQDLGPIELSENPGAWVRRRDDLRLAIASARAAELRAELAMIAADNETLNARQPDARADVELVQSELEAVRRRLRDAQRAAGAIQYRLSLNTDRRRTLERELSAVLETLQNAAAPVVRARNVMH